MTIATIGMLIAGIGSSTAGNAEGGISAKPLGYRTTQGMKNGASNGAKQGLKGGLKHGLKGGLKKGLKNGLKNGQVKGAKK